jgi:hypothetical protein
MNHNATPERGMIKIQRYSYIGNSVYVEDDNGHIVLYSDHQSALDQCREENRWIPVEERLPEMIEPPEFILCSDGEFTYCGQYTESEYDDCPAEFVDANGDSFEDDGITITHFRPLPSAPSDNSDKTTTT